MVVAIIPVIIACLVMVALFGLCGTAFGFMLPEVWGFGLVGWGAATSFRVSLDLFTAIGALVELFKSC